MRHTIYRKNIRQWEQWSRVAAGLLLLVAAVAVPSNVARAVLVGAGLLAAATGIVGWCPACALVGRRLEEDAARAHR